MIRVGLIGCGQWGLNYLRAMSDTDGAELVAACDVSAGRRAEALRRNPGLREVDDPAKLLAEEGIDAVVVATQASTHFEIVRSALEAGKHVLVEKPMTADVPEARALADLSASRPDQVLMVGHIFRYNPAVTYVRRVLAAGDLGDLNYLYFTRTNLGPIRTDVNVVWDLMTHDVSIVLDFLNRPPVWVSAQGACYLNEGTEDVAFATLGFDNGVIANIRASWLDPRKVREITLVGTRAMAVIDDISPEPVRIFDKGAALEPTYESFGEFKLVTRTGDVTLPAVRPTEPLKNQCQHFVEAIQMGKQPLSDAGDGLRVVQVLTAINQSIAEKGKPVEFDSVARTSARALA